MFGKRMQCIVFLCLAVFAFIAPSCAGEQFETPEWFKTAVFYEIFVRSFYDASGDGIGDFQGLTARLEHLSELGVNAIWLMPINPSPSYHGYDVTDYKAINPDFGTMEDFEAFMARCKELNIRVIKDLVINHSSSEHPWFIDAASGPDAEKRDYYVWHEGLPEGRWGVPWGGGRTEDVWHEVDGWFYYAAFWRGMPDLNHTHEPVRDATKDMIDFWLDKGVDGFRLDAIRYLIETGPATGQADTEENHRVLQEYALYMKSVNPEAVFVGEAWTRMDEAVEYYGNKNQLDSVFNFDLAGSIINSVNSRNANAFRGTATRVQRLYPEWAVDSPFLTNHDMPRVATQLNGDIDKMKTAAAILLTVPGAPFLYYGEEIGMKGSKPDPNIRTPMQWTAGPNAGFTTATPWKAPQPDYNAVNVAAAKADPDSLWHHYRSLIEVRHNNPALALGTYKTADTSGSSEVLAYTISHEDAVYLMIHNLDDTTQQTVIPALSGAAEVLWNSGSFSYDDEGDAILDSHTSVILRL